MAHIIRLKRKKRIFNVKGIIVVVVAIILATVGIKAADNLLNSHDRVQNGSVCPEEMIFITSGSGGFCLDKYEAAAGANCPYINPSTQNDTRINISDSGCRSVAKPEAYPWRFISRDQAAAVCAKVGKRLPTNSEWLQGALGTPDKADGWMIDDCQVSNNWSSQPGVTGSGKNCVSSAGAFDMIGNVWEWTEGVVIDGSYNGQKLPSSGYVDSTDGAGLPGATNVNVPNADYYNDYFWIKASGLRAIARGGYWNNESSAGQYSAYIVVPPSAVETGIGFRCAK